MAFNFILHVNVTTSQGNTYSLGDFGNAPSLNTIGLDCSYDGYDEAVSVCDNLIVENIKRSKKTRQLYIPTKHSDVTINSYDDPYNIEPYISDPTVFVEALRNLGVKPENVTKLTVHCLGSSGVDPKE